MTIVTLEHCLICYKYARKVGGSSDSWENASLQDFRKNGEICDRFCTLVSRYLPLTYSECGHFPAEKTIKTKLSMSLTHVCDRCLHQLETFCQMYDELQHLQFKMNLNLEEISGLMEQADNENYAHLVTDRGDLELKLTRMERTMEEIDNFRNAFKTSARKKGSTVFPLVRFHSRCDESDDSSSSSSSEDLFMPVKRNNNKKVHKVVTPAKSCDIRNVRQSTVDEDSDSDYFSPVVKNKKKSDKNKSDNAEWKPKSKLKSSKPQEKHGDEDSDDNLFIPIPVIKIKSKSSKHNRSSKDKNRKLHSQEKQSPLPPSASSSPLPPEPRKRKSVNGKVNEETELEEMVTIQIDDKETMSNSDTFGAAVLNINMVNGSRSRSHLSLKNGVSGSDFDFKKAKMEEHMANEDKKWDMENFTKNGHDLRDDEAIRDKNEKEIVEAWGKVITLT